MAVTTGRGVSQPQERLRAPMARPAFGLRATLAGHFRILRRDRFAVAGAVILLAFVLVGTFAPQLAPSDPWTIHYRADGSPARLDPPSREHLFGTTNVGRDILSQTIYGTRTALFVGFTAAILVTFIGTNIALWSGYFKGRIDDLFMRLADVAFSIPFEPFAIVLAAFLSPDIWNIILAMALLMWRTPARTIRAQVLSISERPAILAARVAGAGHLRIVYRHIMPHILPLCLFYVATEVGLAIIMEASVSFLGFGDPTLMSWGQILNVAFNTGSLNRAWWWTTPPGVAITLVVLSVFFISRAYEEVVNPRLRRV